MVILLRAPSPLLYIAFLLWIVLVVVCNVDSQTTRSSNISCIDSERWALLEFKASLVLGSRRYLSDWSNENMECCRWQGIGCSKSGHVVTLVLHGANHVYCENVGQANECTGEFVGSLKRLRYLNFSNNPLTGTIPHQLGNLSVLETLDLNQYIPMGLQVDSLAWVAKLTSLKYLDLSGVSFSQSAPDWLQSVSKLPYLANLFLQNCELNTFPTPKSNASTSLEVVDLSGNILDPADLSWLLNASMRLVDFTISYLLPYGPIPDFLSKLVSVKHLHLRDNGFEGAIPETFSNLSNLLTLDLSNNHLNKSSGFLQSGSNSLQELRVDNNFLQGNLPNLPKFPSLHVLTLTQNKFRGSLAQLLWKIPNLSMLDVSSNHFYGIVTEAHFQNLFNLQVLSLSMNSLTLNFSTSFRPPFQLRSLNLRDCKLGKSFPLWLRTQKDLIFLDMSNSGISDVVPTWFWNISSKLHYLNVSYNSVAGTIPPNSLVSCYLVDLSFSRFHGLIPKFSRKLQLLDLSSNTFSGGISFLCGLEAGELYYLDLSNNLLSGNLPNCWEQVQRLVLINLNNNNFSGFLPDSMGSLYFLRLLSLRNNSFSGQVPQSMEKCDALYVLDLGENQFSGTVPKWIGTNLIGLGFLRLNSNKFGGKIPSTLCTLSLMQILDLSYNKISGVIPSCLNNFKAMSDEHVVPLVFTDITKIEEPGVDRIEDFIKLSLFWKGLQVEFKNVDIQLLNLIDLSSNRLSGLLPEELTYLYELVSLNLSHNALIGPIPDKIGEMRMLESLDLSGNQLSGEIPWSMANLTSLSYLDLSYNSLSGSIPVSTQLQSFNDSMFRGNLGLCGAPLLNSCHQRGKNVDYNLPSAEGGDNENLWMYISIVLGFMLGFWGVCGTLILKDTWRQKYFQILDLCNERFLVLLFIGLASLKRKFASCCSKCHG